MKSRLTLPILLIILGTSLGLPLRCLAQSEEVESSVFPPLETEKEMRADLTKAGGEYDLYDFDLPELTRAPKGYEPFYISHFGRHGARYALGDKVYEQILGIFRKGLEMGKLTAIGQDFLAHYEIFYPHVAFRGGELTRKGQEQHRKIARKMVEDFPEVFEGETVAEALSTDVHRVLLSMAAFTNELDRLDEDFNFTMDMSRAYFPYVIPSSHENPDYIASHPRSREAQELSRKFQEKKLDLKQFASRFFNDVTFVEEEYGLYKLMMDIRTIIVDIPSLDFVPEHDFNQYITEEELICFWEVWNLNGYLSMGFSPYTDHLRCWAMSSALRKILEQADQDICDGKVQLRLKFTHDVALLPMLSLMGVNSFGKVVEDPEEVKNYWRCFDVPMASNIQWVFYRNTRKKGIYPEVLVKVLLNGREARLPMKTSYKNFYSWEDMKEYYFPILEKAEKFLENY